MDTFIKVIEIWTLDHQHQQLQLSQGVYGDHSELRIESEGLRFAFNEGLPGRAWATGTPQIIAQLENSYFQRKEIAQREGLNAGIAIPLFSGEFLLAVVVFLCGNEATQAGAIELWKKSQQQLQLESGYYGNHHALKLHSQQITFQRGEGLPGSTWDYRVPILEPAIRDSSLFLRSSIATLEKIDSAIALPLLYPWGDYVMTFLSANNMPIARRCEVWLPNREREKLLFHDGFDSQKNNFRSLRKGAVAVKNEGLVGKCWLSGVPLLSQHPVAQGDAEANSQINTALALPMIEQGLLKAIVVIML